MNHEPTPTDPNGTDHPFDPAQFDPSLIDLSQYDLTRPTHDAQGVTQYMPGNQDLLVMSHRSGDLLVFDGPERALVLDDERARTLYNYLHFFMFVRREPVLDNPVPVLLRPHA